ncbi:macro domain-containing protein RSc0334 isoform X2 [Nilaparvata lugens]|uniref:macro domain-containing protein RSc0334 isoform X2 n=1 Tax=Nilaparvata lugens TaxID=108931 RepID=UPI00193CF5A9|nr:macro domain-containing protein RSc0334 isoform X2 [Nilaparvata lugens]
MILISKITSRVNFPLIVNKLKGDTTILNNIFNSRNMASFQEIKDKILNLSLDEKRKLYKCGAKYVILDKVETWADFYSRDNQRLVDDYNKTYGGQKSEFDANVELNRKVSMWQGDITTLEIDAIVNAANKALMGGGGVDGAIHRAAGPHLKEECATLHGCETGDAKITGGYNLPAKYVIHTVGPVGEKPSLLESCYNTSLDILSKEKLASVAFPCISTGVYGYPQEKAAHVALKAVRKFLESNSSDVDRVIFCLFMPEDVKIYENLLQMYFPH